MAKELYLYSPIFDFTAERFISQLQENMGFDVDVRVMCNGGGVKPGYGMCAKVAEHGRVVMLVDGSADSMAANLLMYAKRAESLDVSTFLLHAAAFEEGYTPTNEERDYLIKINKDLKAKMLERIDPIKFKEVTGYTIDDMFNPEKRIDIRLDARQALAIGLISKINKLTPADASAMNERMVLAFSTPKVVEVEDIEDLNKNPIKMTSEDLKSKHPDTYASILKEGIKHGTDEERDRVGAWAVFAEIDPKAVAKGIEDGSKISSKAMAEFALKAVSPERLKAIAAEAPPAGAGITAEEVEKTKKEKEVEAFEKEVRKGLGLKSEV